MADFRIGLGEFWTAPKASVDVEPVPESPAVSERRRIVARIRARAEVTPHPVARETLCALARDIEAGRG